MGKGLGAFEMSRCYANYLREQDERALNTSRGTLWWVKEEIWKAAAVEQHAPYNVVREGHPGVSIKSPRKQWDAAVPMLYGSSRREVARGWNEEIRVLGIDVQDRSHATFFGQILAPVCIARDHIHPRCWTASHVAHPVLHKPQLDPGEQAQLDRFIKIRSQPKSAIPLHD